MFNIPNEQSTSLSPFNWEGSSYILSLVFWKNHLTSDSDKQSETIQITVSKMIIFIFMVLFEYDCHILM